MALDPALPVGELESEVGLDVPVLPVRVEGPVRVDIVEAVARVVEESAVVLAPVEVVTTVALVVVAELAGEETDSTVFSDSTTNGAV